MTSHAVHVLRKTCLRNWCFFDVTRIQQYKVELAADFLQPLVCEQDMEDADAVSIALEDIVVGEEYEGVVNNVVTYGAFVDIGTEVHTRNALLLLLIFLIVSFH